MHSDVRMRLFCFVSLLFEIRFAPFVVSFATFA
jgi:hypothetical protein